MRAGEKLSRKHEQGARTTGEKAKLAISGMNNASTTAEKAAASNATCRTMKQSESDTATTSEQPREVAIAASSRVSSLVLGAHATLDCGVLKIRIETVKTCS